MNHILKRLRESRLREAESHEYKFNIPWREVVQDEYDTVATVYNPRQMDYASDIMEKAEEDFNDADMASYARDDGLGFVKSMTMSFDEEARCIITVETTKVLGDEDMHRLIEYLTGQMSDGWGEGFEQKEIAEFTEQSEEWVEDEEGEGYYEEVEQNYYVSGQFWWSSEHSHPYKITQISEAQNESAEALSVDDMRRELVKYGDYTQEEANSLKGLQLTAAWSKLPRDIREEKDATSDYRREVEKILNHQLGSYETGVNVLGVKVKSETPGTVTLDVEYDVNIQIPMVDPEDGRTYYEQEVEYRRRTMTIEAPELNESGVYSPYDQSNRDNSDHNKSLKSEEASHPYVGKKVRRAEDNKVYSVTGAYEDRRGVTVRCGNITMTPSEYKMIESSDSEERSDGYGSLSYQQLRSEHKYHKEFKDRDHSDVLDFIEELDSKNIPHTEYYHKRDRGCTVFYESASPISNSRGTTFKNAGYTWEVLDAKGDYTLVYASSKQWHPYVVAWKLSDDGSWAQGHYFKEEEEARQYLAHKTK